MPTTKALTEVDLNQFTGTQTWFRHPLGDPFPHDAFTVTDLTVGLTHAGILRRAVPTRWHATLALPF
jgi:hypothetical protein